MPIEPSKHVVEKFVASGQHAAERCFDTDAERVSPGARPGQDHR
jgi:hypothetical protein